MSKSVLLNLPAELLYQIFDHLEARFIICSVRRVCSQFYVLASAYNRFELECGSMSEADLKLVSRFVQPENVVSLKFSTAYNRDQYIQLFLSYFNICRFTRLHSITFCNVRRAAEINRFLEHVTSITSFSLTIVGYEGERDRILESIFPLVINSKLRKLSLHNLNYTNSTLPWPIQSTLEQLTIQDCTYDQYCVILSNSFQLKSFTMRNCIMNTIHKTGSSSLTTASHLAKRQRTSPTTAGYHQLISLAIGNCELPIKDLELLLSMTPSLVYLKLVSPREVFDSIFNGSYWKQYIQNTLPLLNKFEFLLTFDIMKYDGHMDIESLILPFHDSFWLSEKRWFVACDYIINRPRINLYTTPVCVRSEENKHATLQISSTDGIVHAIFYPITLTQLDLSRNQITDIGAQHIANAFRTHTNLETLDLSQNRIGNDGAQYLFDALKENKIITNLKLEGNIGSYCTAVSTAILIKSNKQTHAKMNLKATKIGNDETRFLADALENNKTITELNLSNNEIGDIGAQYLAHALRDNKTLTSLIFGCDYRNNEEEKCLDIDWMFICDIISNETLTLLDLSGNEIGNTGAQHFATALQKNQTLTILNLESNRVQDDGMKYLAKVLENNKTLKRLDLAKNPNDSCALVSAAFQIQNDPIRSTIHLRSQKIGDDEVRFLADAFSGTEMKFIELDLSDNEIGDVGAECLARVLQNNKTLKTLSLLHNRIGLIGLQCLLDAFGINQVTYFTK
ncbi:unnamed protein product [Rotaria magnacalcarata]|uniref:F-box domain-containing protein n=4 Tax=Rotaria TaxID=231623 RepID=A0A8S2MFS6_9BILA|nr:unnamed protein product [Rotaria magnacalcarata]CAF3942162.1 unnamed protein product [Rotaria magnacalcarata]